MIKFLDLKTQCERYNSALMEGFERVLSHQHFVNGPECKELEQALASYLDIPHVVLVSSGTDALLCSLMALNVRPGDEVITSGHSFAATVEAIFMLGARPVYVDCEKRGGNLDYTQIEALVTEKTKAVLAVSLYGDPCELQKIKKLCDAEGIALVEDASQSFGAHRGEDVSCKVADISVTSFFPSKPLGATGNLGAVFTKNSDYKDKLLAARCHGQTEKYKHTVMGWNAMPSSLEASAVFTKLKDYPQVLERRRILANNYNKKLSNLEESHKIKIPTLKEGTESSWCYYVVQVPHREVVLKKAKELGLELLVHYPRLLPENEAFRGRGINEEALSRAKSYTESILSLPLYDGMTEKLQDQVISIFEKALIESL